MAAGVLLGNVSPNLINAIAAAEVASVNLVVAVLIWAMVYPMMVGVDPRSLKDVAEQPRRLMIWSCHGLVPVSFEQCLLRKK